MDEQPRKTFGQLLVDSGIISESELEEALRRQEHSGRRLGAELRDMGLCTSEDVEWALSAQFNLPFTRLAVGAVDRAAARLIPAELARDGLLVPTWLVGNTLHVAIADPTNREMVERALAATDRRVQFSLALPSEIRRAINEAYGAPQAGQGEIGRWESSLFTADEAVEINRHGDARAFVSALLQKAAGERVRALLVEPTGSGGRIRKVRGVRADVIAELGRAWLQDVLATLASEAAVSPRGELGFSFGRWTAPSGSEHWLVRIGQSAAGRFAVLWPALEAPSGIEWGEPPAGRIAGSTLIVGHDLASLGLGWSEVFRAWGAEPIAASLARAELGLIDSPLLPGVTWLPSPNDLVAAYRELRQLPFNRLAISNPTAADPASLFADAELRGLRLATTIAPAAAATLAQRFGGSIMTLRVVDVPQLCPACRGVKTDHPRPVGCDSCFGSGFAAIHRWGDVGPLAAADRRFRERLAAGVASGEVALADAREIAPEVA